MQVTKAPRAAAALMLAPIVDKWIAWLQQRTPLKTRKAVSGEGSGPRLRGGLLWPGQRQCFRVPLQPANPNPTPLQVFFVFLATCISLAFTVFGATVVAWA